MSQSSHEHLRPQYEFERKYHHLLLEEGDAQRRLSLYGEAYGELYRLFFGEKAGKTSFGSSPHFVEMMLPLLRGRTIVDVGCGLGEATLAFGRVAREAIGVEVDEDVVRRCDERARAEGVPACRFVVSRDGSIPLPDSSVDLVYSNNVLEHLHPDDARMQMREAHRVLRSGGRIVVITPPAWNGPHDVSQFFLPVGAVAEGLHLKEYNLPEAGELLRDAGFRRLTQPWIEPGRLRRWGGIRWYPWLQRSLGLSLWLESSPARRSGFLTGTLCLDMICLMGRK